MNTNIAYMDLSDRFGTADDIKGFTLIELLVVISIIGVLSTVAFTSVTGARYKANNVKKQADFENISKALNLFYYTYGRMPNNYNPGSGACEGGGYYEQSMQELVDVGMLVAIPTSPDSSKYCYYNYGANNSVGALIVTSLLNTESTTIPLPSACRPFTNNWCSYINASRYHCVCNPY